MHSNRCFGLSILQWKFLWATSDFLAGPTVLNLTMELLKMAPPAAAKSLQSCPTLQPGRWQLTRLPHPWDSPGKNTGVGCHFLLQCMTVKSESEIAQSCPTLRDPMDCSLPGSSVRGIFQARLLEWGAIAFSMAPISRPRFPQHNKRFSEDCISHREWCLSPIPAQSIETKAPFLSLHGNSLLLPRMSS